MNFSEWFKCSKIRNCFVSVTIRIVSRSCGKHKCNETCLFSGRQRHKTLKPTALTAFILIIHDPMKNEKGKPTETHHRGESWLWSISIPISYQHSSTRTNSPVWPVTYTCAQAYHPGNGSHGQMFRPY